MVHLTVCLFIGWMHHFGKWGFMTFTHSLLWTIEKVTIVSSKVPSSVHSRIEGTILDLEENNTPLLHSLMVPLGCKLIQENECNVFQRLQFWPIKVSFYYLSYLCWRILLHMLQLSERGTERSTSFPILERGVRAPQSIDHCVITCIGRIQTCRTMLKLSVMERSRSGPAPIHWKR